MDSLHSRLHKLAGAALVAMLLALAVISFVLVRAGQGAGAQLLARQEQAAALTPAAVERVVRAAPEAASGARGRSAACTPGSAGELRNPWRCTITYPSGQRIAWRIMLRANGSYLGGDQVVIDRGEAQQASGEITGCCVTIP